MTSTDVSALRTIRRCHGCYRNKRRWLDDVASVCLLTSFPLKCMLMCKSRTHTLYKDRLYVVAFAALILLVELVVNCWLVQSAIRKLSFVNHTGNFSHYRSCSSHDDSIGKCYSLELHDELFEQTAVRSLLSVDRIWLKIEFRNSKHVAPASAWLPLLYETVIFALTMYRVSNFRKSAATRRSSGGLLLNAFRQEGLAYYR